jgi:capsular exopolysaccharide synthesis family protein
MRPVNEPDTGTHDLALKDYLAIFNRNRRPLLGVFVAVLGIALAWTLLTPAQYQSTASVVLRTQTNQQLFPSISASQTAQFNRQPEAELEYISSTAFVSQAAAQAPESATVKPRYDDSTNRSSIIEFVATSRDPVDAQQAAKSWAEFYLDVRSASVAEGITSTIEENEAIVSNLEAEKAEVLLPLKPIEDALLTETDSDTISRLTTQRLSLLQALEDQLLPVNLQIRELGQDLSRLRIASTLAMRPEVSARISTEAPLGTQYSPNLMRNMSLAAIVGVLLAAGAALLYESLRNVITSPSDLEAIAPSIPVLTQLPAFPKGTNEPLHLAARTGSQYAEALERGVSALLFQRIDLPNQRMRVLITSAMPTEGKTTVASHLAARLGLTTANTMLIGADLRRPELHNVLSLDHFGDGLGELLHQGLPLAPHFVEPAELPGVRVLVAGAATDDAASLLRESFRPAIDGLPQDYDILLVDAPPVLAVTDSEVMVGAVDTVIVVVRAGKTTRGQLKEALQRLFFSGARIGGFILVGTTSNTAGSYSSSYSYTAYDDSRTASSNGKSSAESPGSGAAAATAAADTTAESSATESTPASRTRRSSTR